MNNMHPALIELQERNLINQSTDKEVLSKLLDNGSAVYCGFDPTADSLHIGSLLPLTVLKLLKEHGVPVIALIGGATGRIGDPSFKAQERQVLDEETVERNLVGIKQVIKSVLGDDTKIVNNYSWTKDISVLEFLRDYGKCFTVNNMMNKESVRSRIERPDQGISFTEFAYPILQGMDFEHLFEGHNCSIQIGGSDQWGNMISGIDVIHKMHGNEVDCGVITLPLVTKSDGTKFGKSENGTIWLSETKTTPYEFYQFFRNIDDAEIPKLYQYFKPFVFTVDEIIHEMTHGDPNLVKIQFAVAMTALIHGNDKAVTARNISDFIFGKNVKLDSNSINMMVNSGYEVLDYIRDYNFVELLVQSGLAKSKKMAREFITNGAAKINGEKINQFYSIEDNDMFETCNALNDDYFMLQRGRNDFIIVKNMVKL